MLRRIRQTIIERNLLRPGMHVVAAVSGGADSTALLYSLWYLRKQLSFQLSAAHLHHGLRGRDADLDAVHVEQTCHNLGIPLITKYESVLHTRKRPGVSMEMAAREARHVFFLEVLQQTKADAVALAHTRNDQVETIMMRLLTGTGIEGLAGMDYCDEPYPELPVIRPMLDVSREIIEAFLIRHQLKWREDLSNQDLQYTRNCIRHETLPFLEQQGFKGVRSSLIRLAEIMREESKLLERQTELAIRKCRVGKSSGALSAHRLIRFSVAEQRRLIRHWLQLAGCGERTADFSLIERIRLLCHREGKGRAQINASKYAGVVEGNLVNNAIQDEKVKMELTPVRVVIPGRTYLKEAGLVVNATRAHGFRGESQKIGEYPAVLYIPRKSGEFPKLRIRSRKPGDWMTPTGMTGRVYIKDLLINQKVPHENRPLIPVIAAGNDVVWVAGYRVAQSWAVASRKAPSWRLTIERIPL